MVPQEQAANNSPYATSTWIAVLGRREKPTDGIDDYCHFLADALARRGVRLDTATVEWEGLGWIAALRKLRHESANWRGSWILLQYTALAWSRRGFPLGILFVLAVLRRGGLRCAIVFHEARRQLAPTSFRDRVRGAFQEWVIRRCFRASNKAIFTIPLQSVAWLPGRQTKAVYIPIGANIPERISAPGPNSLNLGAPKAVAVFGVSLGEHRRIEIAEMAHAAERVRDSAGGARFVVLGKGSAEAREEIEAAFNAKDLQVCVLGRLPAEEVADTLASADVQLYLGAYLTQTRGTAVAGVACGLPIVGFAAASHEPIHDAGVELVPSRDREALASAVVRVLKDDDFRSELRRRSSAVHQSHFSWHVIASGYIEVFASEGAIR